MAKSSKATKKFQSKHLKSAIDHRKEVKKHKLMINKHKALKKSKLRTEEEVYTGSKKPNKPVKGKLQVDESNPFDVGDSDEEEEDIKMNPKDQIEQENETHDEGDDDEEEEEGEPDISEDDDILDALDQIVEKKMKNSKDAAEEAESDVDMDYADDEFEKSINNEVSEDDKIEVTMSLVKQWDADLDKSPSLKLFKNIIQAFKSSVHVNESNKDDGNLGSSSSYKYFITNEKVFEKLLSLTLKKLPKKIHQKYPLMENFNKEHKIQVRTVKKSDSKLSGILKTHSLTLITLLNDISKSNFNLKFILLTLSSIYDIFPYILSFRQLLKTVLKSIINLWATLNLKSSNKTDNNEVDDNDGEKKKSIDEFLDINVLTFSIILNLSKEYSRTILETVINLSYEVYLQKVLILPSSINLDIANASSNGMDLVTYKKLKLIEFMKCGLLVQLFQIDYQLSYQLSFKYIRKLSIFLRNFLKNNSNATNTDKDTNLKMIYNWQFIESLEFWIELLSRVYSDKSAMNELVYPTVQIAIGVLKLNSNGAYFPLKFKLINSLTSLSKKTGIYIPLFNIFIEMLNSSLFVRNSGNSNDKKKRLVVENYTYLNTVGLKVSKTSLNTKEYQLYLINQYLNSLNQYLLIYASSLSFPEFSFLIIKKLKNFNKKKLQPFVTSSNKKNKNKVLIYFSKEINQLTVKVNDNSKVILNSRESLKQFDPNHTIIVDSDVSLPLVKYLNVKSELIEENISKLNDLLIAEDGAETKDGKAMNDLLSEQYFGKD